MAGRRLSAFPFCYVCAVSCVDKKRETMYTFFG